MNTDLHVEWYRSLNKERACDLHDAMWRARTDRVHAQLMLSAAAHTKGHGYWVMPVPR